jgi:hypothetical protein
MVAPEKKKKNSLGIGCHSKRIESIAVEIESMVWVFVLHNFTPSGINDKA